MEGLVERINQSNNKEGILSICIKWNDMKREYELRRNYNSLYNILYPSIGCINNGLWKSNNDYDHNNYLHDIEPNSKLIISKEVHYLNHKG